MSYLLTAGDRQLDLSTPACMGILNITPDSFSDGSELGEIKNSSFEVNLDKVLKRAESMVNDGAQILDVGGESTRPGADEVSSSEELSRVIPVVDALVSNLDVCISVDTSAPAVIAEAISHGAHMINDIRAMTREGAVQLIAESNVAVCLMHMQGQPRTMQKEYNYNDVVSDVLSYLKRRASDCQKAGISSDQILVDPGFGFGKSVEHNFTLLKNLKQFGSLELPILVGVSRKSMLGAVTGKAAKDRVAASVSAATLALSEGANIIRAHDVAPTVDAIRVHCAYSE